MREGLKTTPVENIFKFGFSNKKTNESGIGLFITKQLIEDKFSGENPRRKHRHRCDI